MILAVYLLINYLYLLRFLTHTGKTGKLREVSPVREKSWNLTRILVQSGKFRSENIKKIFDKVTTKTVVSLTYFC